MGTDKALLEVDGVAMASRVAAALRGCGATRVVLVGGDPAWSERLGLPLVPDRWPGEGPLGGLATALLDAPSADDGPDAVVVVAACDQPWLDGASLRRLVDALEGAARARVATAVDETGRRSPLPAAWRAGDGARLARLVQDGARRADAASAHVEGVDVPLAAAVLADVDRPGDLAP